MNDLTNKIKNWFINLFLGIRDVVKLYLATDMLLYSANAAFFLIICSIPIFMLVFSTISLIPIVKMEDFIVNINLLFPNLPYVRDIIESCMKIAKDLASKDVISINAITAIITGSTTLYTFMIGIRKIHNITHRSGFIRLRILAVFNMIVFFVAIILMLLSFILGNMILESIRTYFPLAENIINQILDYKYSAAFVVILVLMLSLYCSSTNFERKVRHNIIGALISTILWLAISNLFSIYFRYFPLNASVYGSLTGTVIVLLWLFICMNIIFIGSAINEVIISEKAVLEWQKEQIMMNLMEGHDEPVDKIIDKTIKAKKVIKFDRPNQVSKKPK